MRCGAHVGGALLCEAFGATLWAVVYFARGRAGVSVSVGVSAGGVSMGSTRSVKVAPPPVHEVYDDDDYFSVESDDSVDDRGPFSGREVVRACRSCVAPCALVVATSAGV